MDFHAITGQEQKPTIRRKRYDALGCASLDEENAPDAGDLSLPWLEILVEDGQ
jgi:hypothetical protein